QGPWKERTKAAAEYVGSTEQEQRLDSQCAWSPARCGLAELGMQQQPQSDIRAADDNQKAPPDRNRIRPTQPTETHRPTSARHRTIMDCNKTGAHGQTRRPGASGTEQGETAAPRVTDLGSST